MHLLTAITYLALSSRLTSAAQCGVEAYAGSGPENTCTGEALASGSQSGEGSSGCYTATNAECIDIVHEVTGANCSVFTYDGVDCGVDDWNNRLECADEGDTLHQDFSSFQVQCTS